MIRNEINPITTTFVMINIIIETGSLSIHPSSSTIVCCSGSTVIISCSAGSSCSAGAGCSEMSTSSS
jgi:hypothetical protein